MFGAGSGVVGSSSSFLFSRHHQQYEQQEELSWVAAIRPPNDHHHHQQHLNRDPARMFTAPTSSAVGYSSSSSTANYSLMMMQQPLGASSHHIPGATSLLGVGSSMDFRIVDPPPCRPHSGIWFILQASTNQAMEPFLPQVPKSYLRIKDGKMMVRLVIKYLVNKLGVDSESEVQFSLLSMGDEQIETKCICDSLGIKLIAYIPLGLGMLTWKYTPPELPRGPRALLFKQILPGLEPLLYSIREKADDGATQIDELLKKRNEVHASFTVSPPRMKRSSSKIRKSSSSKEPREDGQQQENKERKPSRERSKKMKWKTST